MMIADNALNETGEGQPVFDHSMCCVRSDVLDRLLVVEKAVVDAYNEVAGAAYMASGVVADERISSEDYEWWEYELIDHDLDTSKQSSKDNLIHALKIARRAIDDDPGKYSWPDGTIWES